MEIGLSKQGDLHTLTVKGKIRLQNWRVLDKHLETLLSKGAKYLVMDLSEVTLICSTGVGAILHNVKKFEEQEGRLMLLSTSPLAAEIFEVFCSNLPLKAHIHPDRESLEEEVKGLGIARDFGAEGKR